MTYLDLSRYVMTGCPDEWMVLGDAMRACLAKQRVQSPRRKVLEAFDESLKAHGELYRTLAK